jgi:hypothetical protein
MSRHLAVGSSLLFTIISAPILSAIVPAKGVIAQFAAEESKKIQMIYWEKQSWVSNGPSMRLTLWADGRSEITVQRWGKPQKTSPGWTTRVEKSWTIYVKKSPFTAEEARKKFKDAIAAGIKDLRSFPADYSDGGGTVAGVEVDGKLTETVIPMFLHEGKKDNKGSENHKRFLSVDKILGKFDTDATEK